jgi:hypothetical protein
MVQTQYHWDFALAWLDGAHAQYTLACGIVSVMVPQQDTAHTWRVLGHGPVIRVLKRVIIYQHPTAVEYAR